MNDAIMARLFIGTHKGVAFEWFMKLPASFIKTWVNLEYLFLIHVFKDDVEVAVPTLLTTKKKKKESIKAFVERFRRMALHSPSGMSQSTLVETYCHNLQTALLVQIGVAECRTWKQLVQQAGQGKEIFARVKAEEKDSKPRPDKSTRRIPESSAQPKR